MARQGNPISVRLDQNRSSDSSWFSDYYYGKLVYQDVNLRSYFGSIRPPTRLTSGFRLGRFIIIHFPKRTFIHLFFPRRFFPKRRKKARPGKKKGRRAGKRVESTKRAKKNERRFWPIKKKRYGYHARSPSIKKNLYKSLRVSGTFKHPKYAGILNDDFFKKTSERDVSWKKHTHNWKKHKHKNNDGPTRHKMKMKRTLPAVRPALSYSVMQYLFNNKNKMHFDPVVVINHFVARGVAEPSTMGRANAHGRSLDKRIRSHIIFFFKSSTSEKKCLAEDKKRFFHFIRQANDLFFAGTTKTTISLFPFFGATLLFLGDGVGVYNSLFLEHKILLGQLKQKLFYNLVIELKKKCFNINWIEELIKGIEMIMRIILRNRKNGYNSYLNKVKKMQSLLSNRTNTNTLIKPVKIKSVYQSASPIAQYISFQLRKKKRSFRSIFSKVVKYIPFFMKIKGVGIRICCSGRLKGAEIARTECGKYGKISRNEFYQKIDYALAEVSTRYGILGVKVWISYNNKKKNTDVAKKKDVACTTNTDSTII